MRRSISHILPAGTYFIGDPCYAFAHDTDSWDIICSKSFDGVNDNLGAKLIPFKDKEIFMANTAYGDGNYQGSDGVVYGVDAGILGATPIELNEGKHEDLNDLGSIVTFDKPFTCTWDEGQVTIGHIIINTAYEEEVEDEGDFWDADYYDEDDE